MPDTTDEFDGTDETTELETGGEIPQSEGDPDTDHPLADDQPAEDKPGHREARYRVQLRETEAERDQLRGTVEALQRAEVERIAGKTIKQPAGLWAAGVALDDLLDDTGKVDATKVDAAVTAARGALGLDRAWAAPHVPKEGTSTHQHSSGNTWESAFKA
jgi:hypothetical protein